MKIEINKPGEGLPSVKRLRINENKSFYCPNCDERFEYSFYNNAIYYPEIGREEDLLFECDSCDREWELNFKIKNISFELEFKQDLRRYCPLRKLKPLMGEVFKDQLENVFQVVKYVEHGYAIKYITGAKAQIANGSILCLRTTYYDEDLDPRRDVKEPILKGCFLVAPPLFNQHYFCVDSDLIDISYQDKSGKIQSGKAIDFYPSYSK